MNKKILPLNEKFLTYAPLLNASMIPIFEPRSSLNMFDDFVKVSSHILSLFDFPIQRVLREIGFRMNRLLKDTVSSWQGDIMETDDLTVEIKDILLKDTLGLSNNREMGKPIFMSPKTHIGEWIFSKFFASRLTIAFLFSDPDTLTYSLEDQQETVFRKGSNCPLDNWQATLAYLISGDDAHVSNPDYLYLSLKDLLSSPQLLHFLEKKSRLQNLGKRIRNQLIYNQDINNTVPLILPWLVYSDKKTCYSTDFVDLLLEFICVTIQKTFSSIDLYDALYKQSVNTSNSKIVRNDKSDIFRLMVHQYILDSKYSIRLPFLKTYQVLKSRLYTSSQYDQSDVSLDLRSLTTGYCEPKYAVQIFNQFLWPHKNEAWVKKSFSIMSTVNKDALLAIGKEVLSRSEEAEKITEWIAPHCGIALKLWIEHNCTPTHVSAIILATIAKHHPAYLNDWIFDGKVKIQTLIDHDILYILTRHHPTIIDGWVEHGLISVHKLANTLDTSNFSVLHYLAQYQPRILESWIKNPYIDLSVSMLLTDVKSKTDSILHCLATYQPHALDQWFRDSLITLSDLEDTNNKRRSSTLCVMAYQHPEILDNWTHDGLLDSFSKEYKQNTAKNCSIQ